MKKTVALLLMLCLLAGMSGGALAENWRSVYRFYLTDQLPEGACGYMLADLMDDGIPEMLITVNQGMDEQKLLICSVESGSVSVTGELPYTGSRAFLPGSSWLGLCVVTEKKDLQTTDYIVIEDGRVALTSLMEKPISEEEAPVPYEYLKEYPVSDLSGLEQSVLRSGDDGNFYLMLGIRRIFPGDEMPDFSFADCDGKEYSLYSLLEQKDCVLITFFFESCVWCDRQDPYLEKAYRKYADRVAVIAFSPYDSDESIAALRDKNGYSFIMARDPADLGDQMGVEAFPTSFLIGKDRILSSPVSTVLEEGTFEQLFERYLDD